METETPIAVSYPFVRMTMAQRRQRRMSTTASAARARLMECIISYKEQNDGNSPSSRQMMDATGIKSTSVVHFHLRVLEDMGKIKVIRGSSRQIIVMGGRWTYREAKRNASV